MPHRKSITIQRKDGRWVNVASTGTKSAQAAEAKTSRGFATVEAAVASAKRRSARAIPPGERKGKGHHRGKK